MRYDELIDQYADRYDKERYPDFHPVGSSVRWRQVVVECDQADVEAVEHDSSTVQARPTDDFKVLLPRADGVEIARQQHEPQHFHQEPQA